MLPLFPAETMQQTDQLANDILHDSLIAIVADAQNRYPPLTCGGYIHIRARLAIKGTAHPDVFDIRASLDHVPSDLCIIRDEHTICVPDPVHNLLIRFRNAGKIYYFGPGNLDLTAGMHVIVETARGVELGTVMIPTREVNDDSVIQPLKPVIRIATEADEKTALKNREKEKEAFKICLEKIAKHKLDMKLVEAEYTFDNNKLLFYFTADGRIDFRELVKDLAAVFRTRIELRQIGVRDETKIMGGIGICGRELCCHSYLSEFVPVSIKMAKEQNLSLNPTKISGVCGRLMCCLKNEEETYEYLNSRLPNVGDYVTTDDGLKGEVSSVSVLRQMVKVLVEVDDEKEIRDYSVDQLKFKSKRRRDHVKLTAQELKELSALEDKGGKSKIDDAK